MHDRKAHHVTQIPTINNKYLCPVEALKALLRSKDLSPQDPLFASIRPSYKPIIDTHISDALRHIFQLAFLLLSSLAWCFKLSVKF